MNYCRSVLGILLSLSIFSITAIAKADAPPPPSDKDFSDIIACHQYVTEMMKFSSLETNPGSIWVRLSNSSWFGNYNQEGLGFSSSDCKNGVCTQTYGLNNKGYGQIGGCELIVYGPAAIKQQFINNLISAYQMIFSGQEIDLVYGPSSGYYFSGPKDVCSAKNNYQGCQLNQTK